jgi:hypothetical protein
VSLFVLSQEIEDRDDVEVGNWAETLVTWLHTCIDLCFLKLNIGNKYGLCSMLKKCPAM